MALNDEELKGKRFGKLTLLYRVGKDKWGNPIFRFKCDCGKEKDILYGSVARGKTISCGCHNLTKSIGIPPTTKTHGMSRTKLYRIWNGMKWRCHKEKDKDFKNYGGRGIKVCDRWLESFENFYEDMGERPSEDYSIERRDVNDDYCPENCYWILKSKQALNKRNSLHITYKEQTKALVEWARILGIKTDTLHKRIYKYNWSIEQAFTIKPGDSSKNRLKRVNSKAKFIECFGISWPLKVWSEIVCISSETINARLRRGWSSEKAILTPVKK